MENKDGNKEQGQEIKNSNKCYRYNQTVSITTLNVSHLHIPIKI